MSSHKGHPLKKYSTDLKRRTVAEYLSLTTKTNASLFARMKGIVTSTFLRWLQEYKAGTLSLEVQPTDDEIFRVRRRRYEAVEKELVSYVNYRARAYQQDKLGLSWLILKDKAISIYNRLYPASERDPSDPDLKASCSWISKTLKRYNLVGMSLHGEANDINVAEAAVAMQEFRKRLEELCLDNGLVDDNGEYDYCRVYNADQTGLFYQKLPNRIYCDRVARKDLKGVKQMKDKARITLMVATSAGSKGPLAVIGTAAEPRCFSQLPRVDGKRQTPIKYTSQKNAWFDKEVMFWWLTSVFWPYCQRTHFRQKVILILDNCPAHHLSEAQKQRLPKDLLIVFLPPNLTARYQPADQGVIAVLKQKYKLAFLRKLLQFHESDQRPPEAEVLALRDGERGLRHGYKPHVLDAMELAKQIWDQQVTTETVQRCWLKAGCLPDPANRQVYDHVGNSDRRIANMNRHLPEQLKEDIDELCEIVKNLSSRISDVNIEGDMRNVSNEDLQYGLETWCHVEDDHDMQELIVMDELDDYQEVEEVVDQSSLLSSHVTVTNTVGEKRLRHDDEANNTTTCSSSSAERNDSRGKKQATMTRFFSSPLHTSQSSIEENTSLSSLTLPSLTSIPPVVVSREEYMTIHRIPLRHGTGIDIHARFRLVPRPGDGDCWYHALAYHLDKPDDPQRWRAAIAREIEQNLHHYVDFMSVPTETYLRGITHDRQWADEIEIRAAERLFSRPIIIYNPDGRLCRNLQQDMDVSSNPRPMYFYFSGTHECCNHYDALVEISDGLV